MNVKKLYDITHNLLRYAYKHECLHEDTYRRGTNWTICSACGRKWGDDEGGFVPYKEPEVLSEADQFLCEFNPENYGDNSEELERLRKTVQQYHEGAAERARQLVELKSKVSALEVQLTKNKDNYHKVLNKLSAEVFTPTLKIKGYF